MKTNYRRPAFRLTMVAAATSSALLLGACGGGNGNNAQGTGTQNSGGAQQTSTTQSQVGQAVATDPQQYLGKQVTLAGTVGQVINPNAFTVMPGGGNQQGNQQGNGALPGGNGNQQGNQSQQGNQQGQQALLVLTKSQTNLTAGSPVQITGTLTGAYSNQAAQGIIGSSPSQALSAYNGQPFINGSFVSPTISANLTSGNNGGFFGNGVFGGNTDYNSGFWNWGGGNNGGGNNGGTGG